MATYMHKGRRRRPSEVVRQLGTYVASHNYEVTLWLPDGSLASVSDETNWTQMAKILEGEALIIHFVPKPGVHLAGVTLNAVIRTLVLPRDNGEVEARTATVRISSVSVFPYTSWKEPLRGQEFLLVIKK